MLFWIFVIAVLSSVGYLVYQEYVKARDYGDEGALGIFWRNFGIRVIAVIAFCLFLGYKSQNKKSHGWQYHDQNGKEQIQYQGSREQQNDLDAIDRYGNSHSDF